VTAMTAALEVCRLGEFDSSRAMKHLVAGSPVFGFSSVRTSQIEAWEEELACLESMKRVLIERLQSSNAWGVLLEYPIPRRQKRIDAVLLAAGLVLVLEFKTGATRFESSAVSQVEDYALDLHDFHRATQGRTVAPILVATRAVNSEAVQSSYGAVPLGSQTVVLPVLRVTPSDLADVILLLYERFAVGIVPIEPADWD